MTEKRYMIDFENRCITDTITNEDYSMLIEFKQLLNALHEEKEFWKSNCCSQDSFNSILLNELSIAQEQGYKVSDPFKRLMEEKEDLK